MDLFRQVYNCAQSVVAACADIFGLDQDLALRMAASFGGGIGRMRLTCGAACGMFILEGLRSGTTDGADRDGKAANYAAVQNLAEAFRQEHGSLTCGELLGLTPRQETSPIPAERNEAYYQKRPCVEMVGNAVRIFLRSL